MEIYTWKYMYIFVFSYWYLMIKNNMSSRHHRLSNNNHKTWDSLAFFELLVSVVPQTHPQPLKTLLLAILEDLSHCPLLVRPCPLLYTVHIRRRISFPKKCGPYEVIHAPDDCPTSVYIQIHVNGDIVCLVENYMKLGDKKELWGTMYGKMENKLHENALYA